VHVHYFSRAYVDLLAAAGADERMLNDARRVVTATSDDVAERLAVMDGSAVERQILSMSAATPYFADRTAAVRGAQFINDEHATLCRNHPERFSFFAALPMPHVDAALTEIPRAFDDLHAAGVTFTTSINGRPLTDPAFEPVFAELNRRAAVVFLHPAGFGCESHLIEDSGLSWPVGAPVEDAICAMQLLQAEFPRRFPRLKIIVPHLGGFLPFIRYRLDKARRMPGGDPASVQLRKLWYDTANGEPDALAHAVNVYGADRILFGSDYPYWTGDAYLHAVHYLEQIGLSEYDIAAIRNGNARRLFEVEELSSHA
jgi:predicted TIM-barrel fold metal-dependent hydrolase